MFDYTKYVLALWHFNKFRSAFNMIPFYIIWRFWLFVATMIPTKNVLDPFIRQPLDAVNLLGARLKIIKDANSLCNNTTSPLHCFLLFSISLDIFKTAICYHSRSRSGMDATHARASYEGNSHDYFFEHEALKLQIRKKKKKCVEWCTCKLGNR